MPGDVLQESELEELYGHVSADVRAAALGAGVAELDWRARMDAEPEGHARRAILARLERSLSDGHAELLAQALHDPDWRVRSAAGRMLVSLGDVALEPLRNVFLDDDEAARAAAGRALMELGEQQWIEANLPD
jgi:phytoene dehydrogenase-like protein